MISIEIDRKEEIFHDRKQNMFQDHDRHITPVNAIYLACLSS